MLSKKMELDKRMKVTTQNLESKLIKAVEINDEDENDDYGEEDEITFDEPENFVERSESYS